MKKYRVSNALKKYIRRILIRSFYSCQMVKDTSGQWWCKTNAPSDAFHRIVQRAKCEKVTEETGIFYVTAAEHNNELYLTSLLHAAGVTACQVLNDADSSSNHHV